MRMEISISLWRVLINGKLHQIIWINEDLLRGGQSIFSWCCDRHGRFVPRIGSRLSVIAFNLHKRRFATLRLKSGNRTSKLLVRLGLVRSYPRQANQNGFPDLLIQIHHASDGSSALQASSSSLTASTDTCRPALSSASRSEERRVGKACVSKVRS